MLVSLGGRRAPGSRVHTPPAEEEVLNTEKNAVKFKCMSVNAGVLSEQTVLSPPVSSAPANSALCARTTGQPSAPHSWASRGDAVTAPRGQLAGTPGEMKGCDRGHAASHCWQQRLTLPPFPVPSPQCAGKGGSGDQDTRTWPSGDSGKEKRAQGTAGLQVPFQRASETMLKPCNVILFSKAKRNRQNCLSSILPVRRAQCALTLPWLFPFPPHRLPINSIAPGSCC